MVRRSIDVSPHAYSDGIHHKKIAILGIYPPPLGGVSIHIKRVMHKLRVQDNQVRLFDTLGNGRQVSFLLYYLRLLFFLLSYRPDIIYCHTLYLSRKLHEMRLLIWLKRVIQYFLIVVDHNPRHLYLRNERYKRYIAVFLQFVDQHIIIGDTTYKSYQDNGINLAQNHSIESSFLPPNRAEEQKILATYPQPVFTFLHDHSPIITANAFQLSHIDGGDLYGFDRCIELIDLIKKKYPDVGLVLVLATVGDREYFKKLMGRIGIKNLQKNIFFLVGQKELWPLLGKSDLFVRPTLSDSYGMSIAEALMLEVPAVASDVCVRPQGTIIYKAGDQKDFTQKVQEVLQRKNYEATYK